MRGREMGDSYRPTPSPDLGCVRLIALVTFLFCYLNNLQVCSCFPSTGSFRLQQLRPDPFVGVVERGRGWGLRMSILISWLGGLTDC